MAYLPPLPPQSIVSRLRPPLWPSDVIKENARSRRRLNVQKWVVEKQKANAR